MKDIEKMVAEANENGISRKQFFEVRAQLMNLFHGLKSARNTLKYWMKCEDIRINRNKWQASCTLNCYKIVWTSCNVHSI